MIALIGFVVVVVVLPTLLVCLVDVPHRPLDPRDLL